MKLSGPDINEFGEKLLERFLSNTLTEEDKKNWDIKETDVKQKINYPVVDFFSGDGSFVHLDNIKKFEIESYSTTNIIYSVKRKE